MTSKRASCCYIYDVILRDWKWTFTGFPQFAGCTDAIPRRQRRHVGEVMEMYKNRRRLSFARNAVGNTTPVWAPISNWTNPGATCSGKHDFNSGFKRLKSDLCCRNGGLAEQQQENSTDKYQRRHGNSCDVMWQQVWRHIISRPETV